MNATQEYWKKRLFNAIPPIEDHIGRNAAITATYAGWYRDHPELCKWSGMAVIASYRVGIYLRGYQRMSERFGSVPAVITSQIELIRNTNNRIFDDIGWALGAFLDPNGGLSAVTQGLQGIPSHQNLLQGFQLLDQGRSTLPTNQAEGDRLVWEGNRLLLLHEQRYTAQPTFDEFSPWFKVFMSLIAVTAFNFSFVGIHLKDLAIFYPYMLLHGRAILWETHSLPSIAIFEQRWFWVDHQALPLWRRVEEEHRPELLNKMNQIIAETPRRT